VSENLKFVQRELRRVSGGLLRVDDTMVDPCLVADYGLEPQWVGRTDIDARLAEYHQWKYLGDITNVDQCLFTLTNLPNWKGQPIHLLEVIAVLFATGGLGRKDTP
jgi:hypothetical protein